MICSHRAISRSYYDHMETMLKSVPSQSEDEDATAIMLQLTKQKI